MIPTFFTAKAQRRKASYWAGPSSKPSTEGRVVKHFQPVLARSRAGRCLKTQTVFFLFLFPFYLHAGPLEKGFEALKVFNYFEAKENFQKAIKNHPAGGAYGLSVVFSRNDNPFYNIDSAYKYIVLSERSYKSSDAKEKQTLLKVSINQPGIDDQKEKIIQLAYERAKTENTVESFTGFIKQFSHPILEKEAKKIRSKLAFEKAKKTNSAPAYKEFITNYPDAEEIKDAKWLYDFSLFNAMTRPNSIETYEAFVKQYPKSHYRWQAEDSLFTFSTRNETIEEYHSFIKKYTGNHNVKKAWDLVYTLSTIDFTPGTISKFKKDFPDYPDKQKINDDHKRSGTNLYPVIHQAKWGFMDTSGAILIPCTYDWTDDFSEGMAVVINNEKAGYLSKTGRLFISCMYEEANSFQNGIAVVKNNGKFGLIGKTGKQILPFEFDDISGNETNEKIIIALKEGVYKYYDVKGKFLFEGKYEKAGDFSSGRAYIIQTGKYGFINKRGEMVIPAVYDWVESFKPNGIARVKQNARLNDEVGQEKFGLIDTSGKLLLSCEYDQIDEFTEGPALVVKDKKFGFIDVGGKFVIPMKYDYSPEISASNGFRNGLAKVEQNKKRGLINKEGKLIIPCEYDDLRNFSEDLCAVKKGKWGYIDKNKKLKINFQFEYTWDFAGGAPSGSGGLARVKQKGKVGFINKKGEWVVPATYDEAGDFKNGISIVSLSGKKGVLELSGKLLVPCEMEEIALAEGGMLKLEKNGKFAWYSLSLQKQVWAEEGF